ncbi:MAG: hypothetical protein LBU43_05510 [Candidatus Accumulibacter sp.]|jgi:hypothetical protein|nr:hypothetical protein [Accumulibacter sp.]
MNANPALILPSSRSLSERLSDIMSAVDASHAVAEAARYASETTLSLNLGPVQKHHLTEGVASAIARLLAPLVDELLDCIEAVDTLEKGETA